MTLIDALTLPEAERAIEKAHPPFRLYHDAEGEHATIPEAGPWDDLGLPLHAPSVETIEQKIGQWEWEHQRAGWAA